MNTQPTRTPFAPQQLASILEHVPQFIDDEKTYIVRAVNSHEELLEIAKTINEYFVNRQSVNGSIVINDEDKTLAEQVKQALARAEGK